MLYALIHETDKVRRIKFNRGGVTYLLQEAKGPEWLFDGYRKPFLL